MTEHKTWICQNCGHEHEIPKPIGPVWVEASAVGSDGVTYWARVDANTVKQIPERPDALGLAYALAKERAEELARMRGE